MPILPYQNDVCTRKDEAEKSMTDDSDLQELLEDLETLADEWEQTLEWAREHEDICSNEAINVGERKTNELQELIDEYRSND